MKYLMLRLTHATLTRDVPIIFPDMLVHCDIAAVARHIAGLEGAVPIATGDIHLTAVSTHGESETLGLEAREEDAHTITMYDYFHGYVA